MNKTEIIDRLAVGTGLTRVETEAVVNGLISLLKSALQKGERVDIRGFGVFEVRHRAPRVARNPRTNEVVQIGAQYTPSFKPSEEFRHLVHETLRKP
jgi:DNA-binding protein HU-beta